MSRLAWAVVALGATAFLVALAVSGGRKDPGVSTENLDPDVVVMESAQNGK